MRNLRRSIVLGTFVLWSVAMLAVPAGFADTGEDCGPYSGEECEGVVVLPEGDTDDVVEDDVVDEVVAEQPTDEVVAEQDVEVLGEERTAPATDETQGAVSVEPVSTSDEPAVLAVTGVGAGVITLIGVLLIGAGIVSVRSRREGNGLAG